MSSNLFTTPDILLGGRIIVKPLEKQEEERDSGIIVPKTANANLEDAIVLKVDPAIEQIVNTGDTVVYPSGTGLGALLNGDPCLWLEINQVWGIFKKKD
jgi:co-chaperonin GroES (HSP10)